MLPTLCNLEKKYGKLRHCTEKRFLLSKPIFNAESADFVYT